MGGESSKYGALKIILEQYVFNPGEVIRGTINVVINEQMPPSSLFIHFKGAEEVNWVEKRGKHTYTYYNKVIISKTKYQIMSWDVPLPPGSFAVPFVFVLPPGLPGSFCYIDYSTVLSLVYKVYGRLKTSDAKLRDKVNIGILQEIPMVRPVTGPTIAKLVAWCCKKKGQVKLDVRWINDKFSAGVPLQCILDVDNSESLAKVKGITATAYCIIYAKANSYYRRPFKIVMFKSTYSIEILPGKKKEGDEGQPFAFDLNQSTHELDLTNVHTMNGTILDCTFYLDFELELNTSCLCCGDKPLISSIIFVRQQLKIEAPQFTSPQNWNPQMFNPVSIAYDPRFEANDKGESQFYQQYKSGNPNLDNTKFE